MKNFPIEDREGVILNFLDEASPLAWRNYRQRYPIVIKDGCQRVEDHSGKPPSVAFRFDNENEVLINRLKSLVKEYVGKVGWELTSHPRKYNPGVIWQIAPIHVAEVRKRAEGLGLSADEYIEKYESAFSRLAYDDLNGLAEYIRIGLDI